MCLFQQMHLHIIALVLLEERNEAAEHGPVGHHVEGRQPGRALPALVGAVPQEQLGHPDVARHAREVERGEAGAVRAVDVRPLCEKQGRHLEVAVLAGEEERRDVVEALAVGVGALLEEEADDGRVALLGGGLQRGLA